MLEKVLGESEVAVCVKDADRTVLEQNGLCRSICGDQIGLRCEKGCMELHATDESAQWKDWGSRVYRNSFMHGAFYEVTLLCSGKNIITFLQPLKDRYDQALAYFRDKGLTHRETEVVSFMIRGASNADICQQLSISRATLRTHLNNIYRKFRNLGEVPEFIPANRIPGFSG